ncbi:MAG: hypothetical protein GX316_06995 [Firmicutes bacterium]|nr:hypothetical protein [Bacillota bacterium]
MKKGLITISAVVLITLLSSAAVLADAVTSWRFETFYNPNARQVALNLANRQAEVAKEDEDDKTPMERFKESLERMQMSSVIQNLLHFGDKDEEGKEDSHGWLPLGDSWLFWEWTADDETMTVWYWEDGSWVIQPFAPETRPDGPGGQKYGR